jgi:hypothetical protein
VKRIASTDAYFTVNIILAGVILLIMGYSVFYSPDKDNYPIVCIHEKITGQPCPSCGLSHAFSLIVRGRFDEALMWNHYSIKVFIFFVIQFLMRLGLAAFLFRRRLKTRVVQYVDSSISALMAIAAFYQFLVMEWGMLF